MGVRFMAHRRSVRVYAVCVYGVSNHSFLHVEIGGLQPLHSRGYLKSPSRSPWTPGPPGPQGLRSTREGLAFGKNKNYKSLPSDIFVAHTSLVVLRSSQDPKRRCPSACVFLKTSGSLWLPKGWLEKAFCPPSPSLPTVAITSA